MNKTAIQKAIEILREKKNAISDAKAVDRNRKGAYVDAIVVLMHLEATEQKQIEQAYTKGCMYYTAQFPQEYYKADGELYYNETYKTEE